VFPGLVFGVVGFVGITSWSGPLVKAYGGFLAFLGVVWGVCLVLDLAFKWRCCVCVCVLAFKWRVVCACIQVEVACVRVAFKWWVVCARGIQVEVVCVCPCIQVEVVRACWNSSGCGCVLAFNSSGGGVFVCVCVCVCVCACAWVNLECCYFALN